MVAAGIYLVARTFFVFDTASFSSVDAGTMVAWCGGFTSIFAASIALTQWDIKRVLAFSTLSQLGYMVMALGAGIVATGKGLGSTGATAGSFHLFTHAFFKCMLFLGAGSVIHAVHSNDIRDMGGLLKKMPITGWSFLIGCIAIAGIPPFAGFFSKDEILLAISQAEIPGLYPLASVVAFMTAFYMFRLFFLTFTGAEKEGSHAHESPLSMTTPLIILAVCSVLAGFTSLGPNGFGNKINYERNPAMEGEWKRTEAIAKANPEAVGTLKARELLAPEKSEYKKGLKAKKKDHSFHFHLGIAGPATLIGFLGILLAFLMYYKKSISAEKVARGFGPLYTAAYNKYYIDEIYLWLLHKVYLQMARAIAVFDRRVIDGFMNGLAWISQVGGGVLKLAQSGQVQAYALVFFFGLTLLLLYLKGFGV